MEKTFPCLKDISLKQRLNIGIDHVIWMKYDIKQYAIYMYQSLVFILRFDFLRTWTKACFNKESFIGDWF